MENPSKLSWFRFSGFTLVELLVVLFIAALIFSLASLSFTTRNHSREVEFFIRQLTNKLEFARQVALLKPVEIGFAFRANQYEFYQLENQGDQFYWALMTQISALKPQPLIPNVALTILGENNLPLAPVENAPPIQFYSNGNLTPFKIEIVPGENLPKYEIIGNRNGEITYYEAR